MPQARTRQEPKHKQERHAFVVPGRLLKTDWIWIDSVHQWMQTDLSCSKSLYAVIGANKIGTKVGIMPSYTHVLALRSVKFDMDTSFSRNRD